MNNWIDIFWKVIALMFLAATIFSFCLTIIFSIIFFETGEFVKMMISLVVFISLLIFLLYAFGD